MDTEKFVLTENHLKLLKEFSIGWQDCVFGAPEVNPKRPYGNSNVHLDMITILGFETVREGFYKFSINGKSWILKGEDKYNIEFVGPDDERLINILNKLHKETETALEIVLQTQSFVPGEYEREKWVGKWIFCKTCCTTYDED